MKVPIDWLKEFTDYSGSIQEIADQLTWAGLEIESLQDQVLDIKTTPNRGDWLSIVGLARELSAMTGSAFHSPTPQPQESEEETQRWIQVEIHAPDLAPRYCARILRGVQIKPSPQWLQKRLESAGLRPICNVVDATNYVMLEMGQPLHAFDYDTLIGKKIVVRRALPGEKLTTLDSEKRELSPDFLVIADAERAVALAGVMGGIDTEVTPQTKTILLESAHFTPSVIRRAVKRLGISTESSYRFERWVDPSGVPRAADRAAELIQKIAGGEILRGIVDVYPKPYEHRKIRLAVHQAQKLLGIPLDLQDCEQSLQRLGLKVQTLGEGSLEVEVPSFRPDLVEPIDLIEEIARIMGYQKIPSVLPPANLQGRASLSQQQIRRVRHLLCRGGLQEVLTHSLIDPEILALLWEGPLIPLRNPISPEYSVLRPTLLPGLLLTAQRNAYRGTKDVHLFEVGKVFLRKGDTYEEKDRVAGLLMGTRIRNPWNLKSLPMEADFFAVKGVVEELLEALHVSADFCPATAPGFHPGRTAQVVTEKGSIGILGELHPSIQEQLELPSRVYLFEIDLEGLFASSQPVTYHPLSRYPALERDLALLIPISVPAKQVERVLKEASGPLLESLSLFDVYTGPGIPEGFRSLAFHLTFRSPERTLTEEDITPMIARILEKISQIGGRLR